MNKGINVIKNTGKLLLFAAGLLVTVPFLLMLLAGGSREEIAVQTEDVSVMDAFDGLISEALSDAEAGARSVYKHFWINEDAAELPPRDDSKYGTADSPSELQWLIDEAAPLLKGQELLFNTDIQIREGTKVTYYFDESILAITWQQVLNRMVYTIAEIKIADPSQFRRYMADGYFGSERLYTTTQMSEQAGAVIACSGDYFRARKIGIVVYEGQVKRFTGQDTVDSCFVNTSGDLILTERNTFTQQSELEAFIAENDIQFSFAFGPVLIKDGIRCNPERYGLGEIRDGYPRAALCQKDELHYLMVVTNGNRSNINYPTTAMLTDEIEKFGVQQAYSLDGGQTGAIAMQDRLMNPNEYKDGQRRISDMFFFATAVPRTEKTGS